MTLLALMRRILIAEGALAAGLLLVGGLLGWLVGGREGLIGVALGVAVAVLFMALTAAVVALAARLTRDRPNPVVFFGVVLGGWLVKLVVFIAALLLLRGQDWLDPGVFGVSIILAVVGSLVIETVVMARSRVPYVG